MVLDACPQARLPGGPPGAIIDLGARHEAVDCDRMSALNLDFFEFVVLALADFVSAPEVAIDRLLEIKNNGTSADRLIGGSVSVAKSLQVHNMMMEDGVMKMREVTGGIEIKPGETIKFEPGSSHLMFVNLMQALREGEKVRGTLTFEHAGKIDIEYAVVGMGAKGPGRKR